MPIPDLLAIATRQHGAFSSVQAFDLGVSRRQLAGRVKAGLFTVPRLQTYVVAGSPPTREQRIVVAALSYTGVASHQTAAELWLLLDRRSDDIHVLTHRWDRVRRPGLVVHEARDLIDDDVTVTDGIPVTTPARTIFDLGAEVAPQAVAIAVDSGLRAGLFTLRELQRLLPRFSRRGRRGVVAARTAIEERASWSSITESALEDRFSTMIRSSGLPHPTAQFEVRDALGGLVCRADFAYPNERIIIELDSVKYHMDPVTFQRDRDKQNLTTRLGWRTLRFTWADLVGNAPAVAGEIGSLLSFRRTESA